MTDETYKPTSRFEEYLKHTIMKKSTDGLPKSQSRAKELKKTLLENPHDELMHAGVKGMKWGVRRYQNKDGSLTDVGKKRYARDQKENSGKKKGNKVGQADPDRWVREDMERSKRVAESSAHMTRELSRINDKAVRNRPKEKLDLSNMSDQEMRNQINRAILERQYNEMFAPQKVSKGRTYARKMLEVGGDVLAVTGSALGIALAIKELRG